jgi:hypothetical protein
MSHFRHAAHTVFPNNLFPFTMIIFSKELSKYTGKSYIIINLKRLQVNTG